MYKRSVIIGGEPTEYNLTLKRIKSYNMRVREGGEIFVSAPLGVSLESIDKFVTDRAEFIHSARKKVQDRSSRCPNLSDVGEGSIHFIFGVTMKLFIVQDTRNALSLDGEKIILHIKDKSDGELMQKVLGRELFKKLYDTVFGLCEAVYPLFSARGVEFPEIKLRHMKSRWGSCHTKKHIITFSTELLRASPTLIEYVVMHEMCHFLYADHSGAFYRELSLRMPDWKERKKALSQV